MLSCINALILGLLNNSEVAHLAGVICPLIESGCRDLSTSHHWLQNFKWFPGWWGFGNLLLTLTLQKKPVGGIGLTSLNFHHCCTASAAAAAATANECKHLY
jgi:hypothetical protein